METGRIAGRRSDGNAGMQEQLSARVDVPAENIHVRGGATSRERLIARLWERKSPAAF